MLPTYIKEVIRYIIVIIIMYFTWELSMYAYALETAGILTIQFSGIVASSWAALTLVLKFIFHTSVSKD